MLARASFAALLLVAAPLRGQDEPPKYPVETNTFSIKLTCDDGPVAGASIRLYACRCEEDRGSHYGWPRQSTDVPMEYTSDEKGQAKLSGIPCHRKYSVGAYHDDYIMPAADRGRRQREPYICEANKETVAVIEMHAIEATD